MKSGCGILDKFQENSKTSPRQVQDNKMATSYTILFHGNCIDGWFSAYIANTVLAGNNVVQMYPISPSQINTWPSSEQMKGTHILLVDVSVQEKYRTKWIERGALSVKCIDHHASAIEHWPADACPINTKKCAAYQTWQYFYPTVPVPFWLDHIDRIDRWDNPTYEDRCVREVLNIIAHKPVQNKLSEAFSLTETFLMNMSTPSGVLGVMSEGRGILDQKDALLMNILNKNGSMHTFTQEYITGWKLPANWLNANVFIIDNTNMPLDTTEASHLIFIFYPHIDVFINYRKKTYKDKTMFVYSARSQGFNITNGTIFKGHPTAAGATLIKNEVPLLPFILTPA